MPTPKLTKMPFYKCLFKKSLNIVKFFLLFHDFWRTGTANHQQTKNLYPNRNDSPWIRSGSLQQLGNFQPAPQQSTFVIVKVPHQSHQHNLMCFQESDEKAMKEMKRASLHCNQHHSMNCRESDERGSFLLL